MTQWFNISKALFTPNDSVTVTVTFFVTVTNVTVTNVTVMGTVDLQPILHITVSVREIKGAACQRCGWRWRSRSVWMNLYLEDVFIGWLVPSIHIADVERGCQGNQLVVPDVWCHLVEQILIYQIICSILVFLSRRYACHYYVIKNYNHNIGLALKGQLLTSVCSTRDSNAFTGVYLRKKNQVERRPPWKTKQN